MMHVSEEPEMSEGSIRIAGYLCSVGFSIMMRHSMLHLVNENEIKMSILKIVEELKADERNAE